MAQLTNECIACFMDHYFKEPVRKIVPLAVSTRYKNVIQEKCKTMHFLSPDHGLLNYHSSKSIFLHFFQNVDQLKVLFNLMNLKNFILDLRENMNIKKLQRIASILQDFPDATIDLDCSPDFLQWKVLAEMLRYQRINLTVWHYRQIYFFSYWKVDKVLYRRHWTENKHNIYPKALAEIQMKHLSCPIDVLLPFVQNDLQHETIEELEVRWLLKENKIQEFLSFCANYNNGFPNLKNFVIFEHCYENSEPAAHVSQLMRQLQQLSELMAQYPEFPLEVNVQYSFIYFRNTWKNAGRFVEIITEVSKLNFQQLSVDKFLAKAQVGSIRLRITIFTPVSIYDSPSWFSM